MKLVMCLAVALSLIVITGVAQAPPTASFDVVSVKRNINGGGMLTRTIPGNFSASNVPARQLIQMAYQVQDFQIVGAPDWAATDRFDVDGRFDSNAPLVGFDSPAQRMFTMMRTLLRDRFGLVAHTETREMPVFALRIARSDGRLGAQLKQSAVDCAAPAAARGRGPIDGRGGPIEGRGGPIDGRGQERRPGNPDDRGGPPLPGTPFSLGERPQCGGRSGFGQMLIGGMPMEQFARQLSQLTGRVVLDRTGLTGGYDIELKFTPTPAQLPPGPPPPGVELPAIDPNGPSLFTALQEQLGLKLDAERGPVQVLVVEKLVPPTEN
jgi:uncharacterized protein (TIGR03435 family)